MNISACFKTFGIKLSALATLMLLTIATSSCDNAIYDDEGDCSVHYRLKFRYDMNLNFADAFAHDVKSVHVYAFTPDGKLAWQKAESGEKLAAEGYTMELDMAPGRYQLIGWCGLENDGKRPESFTVPVMTPGVSTKDELICHLERKRDELSKAYVDSHLYSLFHGMTNDVVILDEDDPEAVPGTHTYTMPLMKDTNHIRIILQHLSGEDLDHEKYNFSIEEENGLMAHDNSLLTDETITYRHWNRESASAGVDTDHGEDARAITSVKVVIADLTVARLMENRKMYLTIRTDTGKLLVRIPVVDYALKLKYYDRYEEMPDQEYLDRQDEYSMTFFLDESAHWMSSYIYINSYRVKVFDVDVNS